MRPSTTFVVFLMACSHVGAAWAAPIDAQANKKYSLSARNGPWMIMVTSLWGETKQEMDYARVAADQLVYELRRNNVPAYIFERSKQIEQIKGTDRQNRERLNRYVAQHEEIAVLAGNYAAIDKYPAQETLTFIKRFQPKIKLKIKGSDGREELKEYPLNLKGAFMTRNPLGGEGADPAVVTDTVVLQLNAGAQHSMFEIGAKYTLQVASFHGNSSIKPAKFDSFDRGLKEGNSSLEQAGYDAFQLCELLRKDGIEAYIYHDRFKSVVSVGAFDSERDPRIAALMQKFRPREERSHLDGKMIMVPVNYQLRNNPKSNGPPDKILSLDSIPKLIVVPKKR